MPTRDAAGELANTHPTRALWRNPNSLELWFGETLPLFGIQSAGATAGNEG